ncbi:MAG: Crp/Fnr family transcriptional regulator [Gammaproteobacteria bacterium]|jgi:CRP-like cAMP-binding protein
MTEADQARARASIRRFPLFAALDNAQLDFLSDGTRILRAARGDILCDGQAAPAGFYGVLDGRLKLALLSPGGREHVFDILQPGMSFGEYSIQKGAPCPLYAEALMRTELLFLGRDQMLSAMERWPQLGLSLVNTLSDRMHRLLNNLATCCLQSASERVASYLLSEIKVNGDRHAVGTVTLPACKAIVACSLDLSPETFSRELHQLERDGVLLVNRRSIHIFDLDRLRRLAT